MHINDGIFHRLYELILLYYSKPHHFVVFKRKQETRRRTYVLEFRDLGIAEQQQLAVELSLSYQPAV